MSDLIQRGLVLLPEPALAYHAEQISGSCHPGDVQFILDRDTALPHISVHQLAFPAANEDRFRDTVAAITQLFAPFEVNMSTRLDIFWGTFIFWDAIIDPSLRALHERLVAQLNPLREGRLLTIHQEMLQGLAVLDELRQGIRENGNPLSMASFRPHITLTRTRNEALAQAFLPQLSNKAFLGDVDRWSFWATELCLTEVGPHGTCPKVLERFPFPA